MLAGRPGRAFLVCALLHAACGGPTTPDAATPQTPPADGGRGAVLVPEEDARAVGVGPPTRGRGFALVVGIDRYESLTKLGAAVADALAVQKRLQVAGYRVTLLRDEGATRKEIMSELVDQLPRRLTPDDSLLVYFAGHGESVGSPQQRMGYLMPVDAEHDRPGGTGIAMSELQTVLAGLPSRHVMFLADACYSGLALNVPGDNVPDTGGAALSYVERLRQRRVRFTLVAGSDDEQAMELDGQGVFTRFFLAGIDGDADQDQNFVVTSDEVYTFVKSRVQAEVSRRFQVSQIPQMARSGHGEFLFELQRGAGGAVASASCEAGRLQSPDTQGHCCWYGQAWSSVRGACVGRPDCPSGMLAQDESCTPQTVPDAPVAGMAQAALRYQQGCEAGNARDCSDLAVLAETGTQGVAKDEKRALELHKRGCDAGDGVACRRLAIVYAEQPGAEARAKSVKCAQKACDAADGRGCQWLAKTLIASAATPANLSRAASLLKTSCDSGYSAGCELLGQLHEQGKGVAQDPKLALDLYAKACDSKDGRCRELARVFAAGTLVQPDLTKAAGYAKTACDGGDPLACARLADALEAGQGVPKNLAGAKQLRVRACIDGVGDACAKAIQKPTPAPDLEARDAGAPASDAGARPVRVLTPALRAVSPVVAAESVRTVRLQREALEVLATDCAKDKTQPGCEQLPAAAQPKPLKPQIVVESVLERAPSKPALTPVAPLRRVP